MIIHSAKDIKTPDIRCIIYAQAGMGKTTIAKMLGMKTLVIDVDRSSHVLRGVDNIDIIYLAEDLVNESKNPRECSLIECVEYIEKQKEYELIFFDNISQLEKNMLTYLGRKGKNDGVPAQSDYQRMQFKIYDYVKRILLSNTKVIITAWEQAGNSVNSDTGENTIRLEPQINSKIINYILGLCNIVAHYEKRKTQEGDEKRYFRLSSSPNTYAKDQVFNRTWCELEGLLSDTERISS